MLDETIITETPQRRNEGRSPRGVVEGKSVATVPFVAPGYRRMPPHRPSDSPEGRAAPSVPGYDLLAYFFPCLWLSTPRARGRCGTAELQAAAQRGQMAEAPVYRPVTARSGPWPVYQPTHVTRKAVSYPVSPRSADHLRANAPLASFGPPPYGGPRPMPPLGWAPGRFRASS
jgi:hypothetical protein